MTKNPQKYIIDGIGILPDGTQDEVICIAEKKLRSAGIDPDKCKIEIFRKSVDARKKDQIKLVYSVSVETVGHEKQLQKLNARLVNQDTLHFEYGDKVSPYPPLVVGMGPCGMLAALVLAREGLCPIIIDRGDCISDRALSVDKFYTQGILDTDSNIQFGAGGAGTFSDGKLLTRINDEKCSYVLKTLHEFGAPDDIMIKAKPHIGTDILRNVVDNILREIRALGGTVVYRCKMMGLCEYGDGVRVSTTKGDFMCSDVILALGHSSRDTYKMLIESNFSVIPKPISVGVRIEHLREDIEKALYGNFAGHPALGSAEYALSDTKGERGVYTFCMCPGGEVMGAASEEGGVVVNGMSRYARDGKNSNSAIAVSVRTEDFEPHEGSMALGAIEFQRRIERAAYIVGGRNYNAPIQTVGDFLEGRSNTLPTRVMPTYMGGKCTLANMHDVLPPFVTDSLKHGLLSFDKKLSGFAAPHALLSGAETRTSAPVRILRGENMCAIGHENIYPCGEGAGYAGGITSAGVDGVKAALAIIKKYRKKNN